MATMAGTGSIIQVIGSTFDAQFPEEDLPDIYNAVKCEVEVMGETVPLTGEVAKHLGGGQVRCVALASTDGLRRGDPCQDTGGPVKVPVGDVTLGRVFNLLGEPIDEKGPVNATAWRPIHHEPPEFIELNPKTEILETGIKVIDLLCPFVRGGKIGLFGGAGVG
ncbi:MAG: F0F1 ATP synthase subunit beta, partial [Planctomycetota bacterium]